MMPPRRSALSRRSPQRGFSLLEVIIALTVLTAVGSLVLERTQAIMDYHIRVQGHLKDINALMNSVVLFDIRKKEDDDIRLLSDHLEVFQGGSSKPLIRIDNFSTTPYTVPISLGYSPYQTYTWTSDRGRTVTLLMPGLLPKAR